MLRSERMRTSEPGGGYPTDLTDAQWALIEPYLRRPPGRGLGLGASPGPLAGVGVWLGGSSLPRGRRLGGAHLWHHLGDRGAPSRGAGVCAAASSLGGG